MKEKALVFDSTGASLPLDDLFSRYGFHTEKVNEQAQVWDKLQQYQYSIVYYNFDTSEQTPWTFIRELRGRLRGACQILVSGPNDVQTAVRMMQEGIRHYWSVPVDTQQIEQVLKNGLEAETESRQQREETLLQIIKEIALTMELDGLINILMDSTMELTDADGGALLLLNDKSNSLVLKAIRGVSGNESLSEFFGLPEAWFNKILTEKKPVFTNELSHEIVTPNQERVRQMIAVPIWSKSEPLAVLVNVKFAGAKKGFSNEDFKLLSLLVEEISGAVYNAVIHYRTKELTIKDDLTDAYNRRYFERYLEEEFMRATRYGSTLSLIFFDVDNLKEVNIQHGHLIGSKTLQEVAHRMILTVRGIDKVVRYGGDEFCVVLPETDTQGAYQVADRIRNIVASKPFKINENIQVTITGSIGIASYPTHATTKEELIRQADKAMFVIKNKSKNAIAVAEPV